MNSYEFSDFIFKTNKTLVFFISGPDGCPEIIKKNSDHIVSLSDFTFPHEMATLILIEQVYRAIYSKKSLNIIENERTQYLNAISFCSAANSM